MERADRRVSSISIGNPFGKNVAAQPLREVKPKLQRLRLKLSRGYLQSEIVTLREHNLRFVLLRAKNQHG